MKNMSIIDSCCQFDITNECVTKYSLEPLSTYGLEVCLAERDNPMNNEAKSYGILLDKNPGV